MNPLSRTASAVIAALVLGSGAAKAADLDYGYVPPPDRYSSAYEDPRYRDLYGSAPRPVYIPPGRVYEPEPPRHPVPPAYVYREERIYRDRQVDWDRREDWRHAQGCLPRREIRERLMSDGWGDFHELELAGDTARVKARRPNGDLFDLKVDRCSGDLVKSVLLERHGGRPYADRGDWRPAPRPYY